jgi:uncharacterized lipoprotein YddW (UPF0748 family)
MFAKTLLLSVVLGAGLAARAASPAVTIEDCRYANDAAASAAWRPMGGSAQAGLTNFAGQPALRLPCNFAGGQTERASWDRHVQLDLSSSRGVQFQVLCRDISPMSHFSFYFQSGAGWYVVPFYPEASGWNTITIDRAEMDLEGTPAGWDHIQTIRISAWRAKDVDTEFYVRDLHQTGVLGADALVAVVRPTPATPPASGRSRAREGSAEALVQQFQLLGISCGLLDAAHLSGEQLKLAQLVVLPQGLALTNSAAEMLARYLAQGGKVLALGHLPAKTQSVAGPTNSVILGQADWPREPERQRELLLAKAGALAPGALRQAAQSGLERIGRVASFTSFTEATNRISALLRQAPKAETSAQNLAAAVALRDTTLHLIAQQQYADAIKQAKEANRLLQRAFCAAQQPEPGEFRAFWCHSAFGVQGRSWDESIRLLADNGFTAILPNMLWGGAAFYDSKVLPVAAPIAERGDQLRECIAACRKYGLQIHVWKVNWNLGTAVPKAFVEQMRQAHRLQANASGAEHPWLCPSHPENQQLEIASLLELVRNYDIDGIHFDYIRYPDGDHCFCAGCKERFQHACGGKLQHWPADVLAGGPLRQQWLDWRRSNITTVVKAVSEQAHAIKPRIKLSAAVFQRWNTDRDSVGQDWKLWCDRGYLDFVCPMDYTPINTQFVGLMTEQLTWAGKVPCYPGLGPSVSPARFGPDRVVEQINLTRKHHTHGFIIFNYGVRESEELVPMLGLGVTRKQ